jgi:hypothetical protein
MVFGKINRRDKMILKGKNKVYKEAMNKKTIYANRDKILKPFNYIYLLMTNYQKSRICQWLTQVNIVIFK